MRFHTRRTVLKGALAIAGASIASPTIGMSEDAELYEVEIRKFKFEPAELSVKVGDRIRWINRDLAPHTATAVSKNWDTGRIRKDGHAEITVTAGMDGSYFCVFHPHMKGRLLIS